jgi:hypothetical protein
MNSNFKTKILHPFISGFIFSIIMAVFDYIDGNDFRIKKFIAFWLLYWLFMMIINKYLINQKSNK